MFVESFALVFSLAFQFATGCVSLCVCVCSTPCPGAHTLQLTHHSHVTITMLCCFFLNRVFGLCSVLLLACMSLFLWYSFTHDSIVSVCVCVHMSVCVRGALHCKLIVLVLPILAHAKSAMGSDCRYRIARKKRRKSINVVLLECLC